MPFVRRLTIVLVRWLDLACAAARLLLPDPVALLDLLVLLLPLVCGARLRLLLLFAPLLESPTPPFLANTRWRAFRAVGDAASCSCCRRAVALGTVVAPRWFLQRFPQTCTRSGRLRYRVSFPCCRATAATAASRNKT